ncbi:MAG: M20/M25/M40 family metallo-hydrolase [Chloroflexi bacterium]|jgi:Zn-dependent M28 family amino/carboxypeptidase|nr:M20/M25/M40 family metallo-hydrolase [Chloroflexota bacterium]
MVSESRIKSDVETLSASPRNSIQNKQQHATAAEWIANQFTKIGLSINRTVFDIPMQSPERSGLNIIGTLNPDSTERPVLIGAHYDTVAGSPGADDNASGVAAMLECARILVEAESSRKIVFAAFDAEELQSPAEGLHGSTAYVVTLRTEEHPSAAVILETIGFSSSTIKQKLPGSFRFLFRRAYKALRRQNFEANSLLILSNNSSRRISRSLEQAASIQQIGLPILPLEVPWWMPLVRNLRRSDHAPFWQAGIPAVMISDTANFRNPNYHKPTDTAETIDPSMIAKATSMILEAITHGSI